MAKTKIVLDSTSAYDLMKDSYDAEILRLLVLFDGKEYIDGEDITQEQFYTMMKEQPNVLPSTSQPTVGKTVEQFNRLKEEGYTDLIVLTFSSALSGTYATTVSAADEVEGLNVHIVDTKTILIPVYQMGEIAYRMVLRDKEPAEIVSFLEDMKSEYHFLVAVGDLTLLRKNGRLSTASALVGNVLKVKPVLELSEEGKLETLEKVRTMKKAMATLVDMFFDRNIHVSDVTIYHTDCLDLAEELRGMLTEKDETYQDAPIYLLTPIIGAHLGRGSVAISYRKRRMN